MNEEIFKEHVDCFFKAVKEHTLLIIIDSKSKGSKAVINALNPYLKDSDLADLYDKLVANSVIK